MQKDTRIQFLAIAAMVVLMAASGALSVQLTASAGRHKLVYTDRVADGDPPQVALGIAMGAFRGLFVNILWYRANELKEAGKYHEAIDLSEAITKLQPRFPRVWVFHAWNMAYNISVATQTPQERWQWVSAGIALLRDEALKYNPNDMLIHKELAWIFLHKIQGYTDDANLYYKRQLAGEWSIVLGEPPPPDPTNWERDHAIERMVGWLEPIDRAPDTLREVIEREPSVRTLVDRLKNEAGLDPDVGLLERHMMHTSLRQSSRQLVVQKFWGANHEAFSALLDDPSLAGAWDALLPYVRRRELLDRYHMHPSKMVRYTREFGPLDWRHPASHSLYWAREGVEQGIERVEDATRSDYDFLNTDRIVVQSIQELYRSGELYFNFLDWAENPDAFGQLHLAVVNPHFVDTYGQVIEGMVERAGLFEDPTKRIYKPLSAGYENFMEDVIRFYYRRGQVAKAEEYKDKLARWVGQNMNDPRRPATYAVDIKEFVEKELWDRYNSPSVAVSEVTAALQSAYISGLLAGNDSLFRAQWDYAIAFHRHYFEEQGRLNQVGTGARMEQMPSDFGLLSGLLFAQMVAYVDRDSAETMNANAPEGLRRYAYDVLVERYKDVVDAEAARGGAEFGLLFPEPSGMPAFRQRQEQLRQQQQRDLGVQQH